MDSMMALVECVIETSMQPMSMAMERVVYITQMIVLS